MVSPFLADDVLSATLMTSPPRRFMAASNEHIVRVEGSKKTFARILPRSTSDLRFSCTMRFMADAVSKTKRSMVSSNCVVDSTCMPLNFSAKALCASSTLRFGIGIFRRALCTCAPSDWRGVTSLSVGSAANVPGTASSSATGT